jgi:soluble cytochrome b562
VYRRTLLAAVLVAAFGIAACDSEPAQRKAFIEFLQSRIVGKPGVHVPKPAAEQTATFGPYAKHYDVITEFHAGLDQVVTKPLQHALQAAPRSLDQLGPKRQEIAEIRGGMASIRAALDKQLAAADAAHAALKQPDDLKPVYDAAYDRVVSQPAKAFAEIFPDVDEATKAILSLAEFLDRNGDKIKINGSMLQVADPSLQPQLQSLINALRAKQEAIQKAQQRLRSIVSGT